MPPLTTLLQLPAVDFHALPGFLSTPAIANLDFNLYMPHLLLPFSFAPPLLAVPPAPELLHIEDTFPVAEEKALDTIPTPTVVADAEFDAADDAADDVYSCTCASNKPPIEFTDISVPKEVLTSLGNPFEIRVRGDLSELSSLQPHERWEVLKQLTVLASGEVTPGEMVAMGLGPIQPGIEAIAAASSSSKSETMGDGDATEEGEEEAAPEWLNTSFTKFVVPVSRWIHTVLWVIGWCAIVAFLGLGVLLGLQGYYEYKMRFWCDNLVKSLALARGWEKVEWEEVEWKEREGKEGEDEEEKREGGDGGRWGVNGEKGEMIDF